MGGEPYWYFVPYQEDIDGALKALRMREFFAGRYNPVMPFLAELCPIDSSAPAPGAKHPSIEAALEASEEDGTRSILDLDHVSETPDYCAVAPLTDAMLQEYFGTTKPTRAMLERNLDFFEQIERGQGAYVVVYEDDAPDEIMFVGYSFD